MRRHSKISHLRQIKNIKLVDEALFISDKLSHKSYSPFLAYPVRDRTTLQCISLLNSTYEIVLVVTTLHAYMCTWHAAIMFTD